jgi:hypothetical protein
METPQWHKLAQTLAYIDFMIAHLTRILESCNRFSKGAKITVEVGLTASLIHLSRGGGYECDDYFPKTAHCMILHRYSLLIRSVLFHRKVV